MPITPNLAERLFVLRLNRGPGPMLDLFGGMSLEAAMLGVDLGIFQALDGEPASPQRLAERLDADEDGLAVLLAFLDSAGYVTADGDQYRLTRMTEVWLLESSKTSYARYFRFWRQVLYPFWRDHVQAAIRDGGPP